MLNAKVDLRFDLSISYALRLRCPTVGYILSTSTHCGRVILHIAGVLVIAQVDDVFPDNRIEEAAADVERIQLDSEEDILLQSFVVCLDVRLRLLNGVGSDCSESNPKQVSHLASDIVLLRH